MRAAWRAVPCFGRPTLCLCEVSAGSAKPERHPATNEPYGFLALGLGGLRSPPARGRVARPGRRAETRHTRHTRGTIAAPAGGCLLISRYSLLCRVWMTIPHRTASAQPGTRTDARVLLRVRSLSALCHTELCAICAMCVVRSRHTQQYIAGQIQQPRQRAGTARTALPAARVC